MAGIDAVRSAGYSLDPDDYLADKILANPGAWPGSGAARVRETIGALSEHMTEARNIDAEVERLMSAAQPRGPGPRMAKSAAF